MLVKIVGFEGGPLALFPEVDADMNGNCLSYQHVGQHGAASREHLNRPAIIDTDLILELLEIYWELTLIVPRPGDNLPDEECLALAQAILDALFVSGAEFNGLLAVLEDFGE